MKRGVVVAAGRVADVAYEEGTPFIINSIRNDENMTIGSLVIMLISSYLHDHPNLRNFYGFNCFYSSNYISPEHIQHIHMVHNHK